MTSDRKRQYSKFLERNSALPIYIQDWYLDIVCGPGNWDVSLSIKGGDIAGALPYCIKSNSVFKWIGMPPLSKLHGPYIQDKYDNNFHRHSIVDELLDQLPRLDFYQQSLGYEFNNWLPYLWRGFSQVTLYSYVFKSPEPEIILRQMAPDCRRRIKKAENNLTLHTEVSFDTFFDIWVKTYKRQNLSVPFTYQFLKKYYDTLKSRSCAAALSIADRAGRIHSVALLIWDNNSAYYVLEGTDPEAPDKNAGIFMKWSAILYCHKNLQHCNFDFEGSISKRIEKIYREMGAHAEPYYVIKKYYSRMFLGLKYLQNLKQYGKLAQW